MSPSLAAGAASARAAGRAGVAGRLLARMALLSAGLRVLQACGGGVLAGPSLTSPWRWLPWLTTRPPATVAFAVLRVAGLALGWYLLALTGLGLLLFVVALGCGSRARVVARLVQAVTLPGLGRVLDLALGTGVAAAVSIQAVLPGALPAAAEPAPGPPPGLSTTVPPGLGATMRRLDRAAGPEVARPEPAPLDPQPVPGPAPEPAPNPGADGAWIVVRGQSFWVVARLRLTAAWGRSPTDSEVARYWTALIDANRDRLGDRRNPNLIYPGQELALPAPSAP